MTPRLILLFSLILQFTICVSCSGQNTSYTTTLKKAHANFRLLAWNEDSVNSILFSIGKSNTFRYTITTHDLGRENTNFYKGTWEKKGDTIFLKYKRSNIPVSFKHFLMLENQGHYLIQYCDSNKYRIYLRIMFDPIGRHSSVLPRPWKH